MQRVNGTWLNLAARSLLATAVIILALVLPFGAGASPSPTIVYDDALTTGWTNWSWNTTADFNHSTTVHAGSNAIAVTHDGSWAGLYLHSNNLIDASGYDTLRFWIHGGSSGTRQLQVSLADANDSLQSPLPVAAAAGSWQLVELSLADLGSLSHISGIVWQDASGSAQPTYYLDDVAFVDSSAEATVTPAQATATPAPATATATPMPTATATQAPPSPTATATQPQPTPTATTTEPSPTPTATATTGSTTADIALSVDVAGNLGSINPHIYGINFEDATYAAALNIPLRRSGGNAATRYNWQLDVSNRASDWFFENIPNSNGDPALLPDGSGSDLFVEANQSTGADSILTVPLIGWTPKSRDITCGFSVSKYGAQQQTDSWRPDCGNGIRLDGSFITGNDPADTSVAIGPPFVQEWIRHLTGKYGSANNGGVRFYNLDNEPMLWHETHRDVHPDRVSYDEIRDLTFQYAPAIKAIDPGAQLLGPTVWGWTAYFYSAADGAGGGSWWNNPPDRNAHGGTPFVSWYLQQMRAYEQQHGQRILDYLDLHYYPQAAGVTLAPAGDAETQARRLRSTRSLWDPTYVDESWINEPVMLIPRMRQWVDQNYPGTKLALTEYNFGGHEHISGALTQADILGIFGREGLDLATLWSAPDLSQPASYAFRIYRNYDGQNSTFGDVRLSASSSNQGQLAVYAARRSSDGATTIVAINKSGNALAGGVSLQGLSGEAMAQVYRYSQANLSAIVRKPDQAVGSSGFTASFPANSITLFVIPANGTSPQPEPTPATEPAANAAHVADLDGASNTQRNRWEASVSILVVDANGSPVGNATVSGLWGDGNGNVSCTTGANGLCQVTSSTMHKNNGTVAFSVAAVDHSTLPYDSSANADPDGDSDGTTITVCK